MQAGAEPKASSASQLLARRGEQFVVEGKAVTERAEHEAGTP
ncbi:MAG: hypothetical protein R3E51_10435 [Rhizobiaceae bacterium]